MKTAEEWMEQLSGLPEIPLISINRNYIKEIQLDAMKEGMRRAAREVRKLPIQYPRDMCYATILTTAEQLTKKNLQ